MANKEKREDFVYDDRRKRRLALLARAPDLSKAEACDLRRLTTMLNRSVSNENLQKFLDMDLVRQGLGGLVVTASGKLAIAKARAKKLIY
ncbi:MAG: hypothetical protein KA099_09525 [Alphaproteobacteria bacterium]|nr:hypothetical protein [Alphaproteobacteria bacterium]MBP7758522.1 hypothetical protein [Alphaproteobacteria bacterium]MBP7761955.1 hypothetical protein [Alphaproteobacteria bacterium]MBP7905553.1 hypothetical protein [Alphaproteobacteria bacterium]